MIVSACKPIDTLSLLPIYQLGRVLRILYDSQIDTSTNLRNPDVLERFWEKKCSSCYCFIELSLKFVRCTSFNDYMSSNPRFFLFSF